MQLHRDEIDGEIVRFLKKWSLSQLNIVDKNILRIAIAEFNYTYEDKADRKVIINEAVELAKAYGGENSYRFINGILSAVTGKKWLNSLVLIQAAIRHLQLYMTVLKV